MWYEVRVLFSFMEHHSLCPKNNITSGLWRLLCLVPPEVTSPCSAWFSGVQGDHIRQVDSSAMFCEHLQEIWKPSVGLGPSIYSECFIQQIPHLGSCLSQNCLIEHWQVLSRREILIAHFLCFLNDLNCLGKEASILNLPPTRGDSHSNKV